MAEEKDLQKLLRNMRPRLNAGDYVFCVVNELALIDLDDVIMMFREQKGYTIIIKKEQADKYQLNYSFITSWITLMVHSSLEAVGLTAAFSKALAESGINCNVVAGFYHDHIFVGKNDTEKALDILNKLSN